MHQVPQRQLRTSEPTVWVLDDVWPEMASMVEALVQPGDQLLAPAILAGFPKRYRWSVGTTPTARLHTLRRHWAMRRVARASGGVRQRTYLRHDRLLARQLARAIDYRAHHLVVAQAWLPWLDEIGVLGGRTFDVVMSRYPFGEVHRLLDQAAAEIGTSATIADFRVRPELVEREAALLARARRIVTPHHGIAALFGERSTLLAWHRPSSIPQTQGSRVAFLGPTIARQRPDIVARLAQNIDDPLIVFGPILESAWDGITVERREQGPRWLDDIGAILHPATLTNQPRALLQAAVNGVAIYANETCGLAATDHHPVDRFAGR
jgi:hypothetical protein